MSKDIVKNYGKSIRSKLLNIAKNEDVYYQTVLTRYFQERLIYRISQTGYRQNFYLKGGALMFAHEGFAARPTLDIDFLGNNISNDGKRIVAAFREICSCPCEEDAVVFDVDHITYKNITELKDYHGVRLSIPVSMDTVSQVLTMDCIHNYLKSAGHPVSHWYYGHFHQSWNSEIDGILFSMLDIMEFKEIH